MCVDVTDNELAYLESVHLFVEILDHYFSNVCELDLVFNFHKVSCRGQQLHVFGLAAVVLPCQGHMHCAVDVQLGLASKS